MITDSHGGVAERRIINEERNSDQVDRERGGLGATHARARMLGLELRYFPIKSEQIPNNVEKAVEKSTKPRHPHIKGRVPFVNIFSLPRFRQFETHNPFEQ